MLEADLKTAPIARTYYPLEPWNRQSLAMQFLLAGGLVSLMAMAVIGLLVKSQIEGGVPATRRPQRRSTSTASLPRCCQTCRPARPWTTASPMRSTRRLHRGARRPADLV